MSAAIISITVGCWERVWVGVQAKERGGRNHAIKNLCILTTVGISFYKLVIDLDRFLFLTWPLGITKGKQRVRLYIDVDT